MDATRCLVINKLCLAFNTHGGLGIMPAAHHSLEKFSTLLPSAVLGSVSSNNSHLAGG